MNSALPRLFLLLSALSPALAFAADLATVSGCPDGTQPFVQRMLAQRILVGSATGSADQQTTWVYSILRDAHVASAVSVEVLNAAGAASNEDLRRALGIAAAQDAPVVFTNAGPLGNDLCILMGRSRDIAYVVVAGGESTEISAAERPACAAGNILFVTALDQRTYELESFANWGPGLVRVAAPAHRVGVVGVGGHAFQVSNGSVAAALVAGRLAVYARDREARGAMLVARFLSDATVPVPALRSRVQNGRVLPE